MSFNIGSKRLLIITGGSRGGGGWWWCGGPLKIKVLRNTGTDTLEKHLDPIASQGSFVQRAMPPNILKLVDRQCQNNRVSNNLDPDQSPNCLQRSSTEYLVGKELKLSSAYFDYDRYLRNFNIAWMGQRSTGSN